MDQGKPPRQQRQPQPPSHAVAPSVGPAGSHVARPPGPHAAAPVRPPTRHAPGPHPHAPAARPHAPMARPPIEGAPRVGFRPPGVQPPHRPSPGPTIARTSGPAGERAAHAVRQPPPPSAMPLTRPTMTTAVPHSARVPGDDRAAVPRTPPSRAGGRPVQAPCPLSRDGAVARPDDDRTAFQEFSSRVASIPVAVPSCPILPTAPAPPSSEERDRLVHHDVTAAQEAKPAGPCLNADVAGAQGVRGVTPEAPPVRDSRDIDQTPGDDLLASQRAADADRPSRTDRATTTTPTAAEREDTTATTLDAETDPPMTPEPPSRKRKTPDAQQARPTETDVAHANTPDHLGGDGNDALSPHDGGDPAPEPMEEATAAKVRAPRGDSGSARRDEDDAGTKRDVHDDADGVRHGKAQEQRRQCSARHEPPGVDIASGRAEARAGHAGARRGARPNASACGRVVDRPVLGEVVLRGPWAGRDRTPTTGDDAGAAPSSVGVGDTAAQAGTRTALVFWVKRPILSVRVAGAPHEFCLAVDGVPIEPHSVDGLLPMGDVCDLETPPLSYSAPAGQHAHRHGGDGRQRDEPDACKGAAAAVAEPAGAVREALGVVSRARYHGHLIAPGVLDFVGSAAAAIPPRSPASTAIVFRGHVDRATLDAITVRIETYNVWRECRGPAGALVSGQWLYGAS